MSNHVTNVLQHIHRIIYKLLVPIIYLFAGQLNNPNINIEGKSYANSSIQTPDVFERPKVFAVR